MGYNVHLHWPPDDSVLRRIHVHTNLTCFRRQNVVKCKCLIPSHHQLIGWRNDFHTCTFSGQLLLWQQGANLCQNINLYITTLYKTHQKICRQMWVSAVQETDRETDGCTDTSTRMISMLPSQSGLLVALGKIKHFFKAPFLKNKALLKHFLWTPAQCIMEKGIDLN